MMTRGGLCDSEKLEAKPQIGGDKLSMNECRQGSECSYLHECGVRIRKACTYSPALYPVRHRVHDTTGY